MGNCKGKTSKPNNPPTKSFEEHKTTKHALKLGVQAGKDEKGEVVLGVRGAIENFKDRVVIVDPEEKSIDQPNKIPKILDVVNENGEIDAEQ